VPDDEIQQAIIDAEDEMRQGGMVAVGDISNTYHSFHQKKKRILQYHTFIEVFDIHAAKTKTVFDLAMKLKSELPSLKHSISPHAPYTVTPELMKKINDERQEVISIHNQETESEDELFVAGKGKLYDILLKSGADVLSMKTGERSLKRTLHQFKQTKRLLLVHNTFTNPQDVREAKELYSDYRNTLFFCLCPHANLYIENRLPDVSLLAKEGLTICVGTDSYASNNSLSIVEELKTLHHSFPAIDLETLLTWATLNGAKALGLENKFGSIEVGKSPGLVLVKGKEIQHLKLTHDTLAERMV
jgi:cytosine/adenosine deaminase-related metal-dependent hydrolase